MNAVPRPSGAVGEMLGALRLLTIQGHYPNHEYERLKAMVQPGTTHVDSEGWRCRGCHGDFIGRRPIDDVCRSCVGDAAAGLITVTPAPADPPAVEVVSSSLTAIRGVLDYALTSETADRQTALERIEAIVSGSRTASGVEPGGSASLVRADLTTVLDALDTAAEHLSDRVATCPDCTGGLCGTCEHRAARAGAFEELFAKLGGDR